MISDLLQRILMNSANLYAVCCLLLWGGLIVFAVVVLCMKAPEKCGPKEKFSLVATKETYREIKQKIFSEV